jgi:succinyl-CoA synthetase alpha subunit
MFQADPGTEAILLIGEIGGNAEESRQRSTSRPRHQAGAPRSSPARQLLPGKRMGHAGAIISGGAGTAGEKLAALQRAGVAIVDTPGHLGQRMAEVLKERGIR